MASLAMKGGKIKRIKSAVTAEAEMTARKRTEKFNQLSMAGAEKLLHRPNFRNQN